MKIIGLAGTNGSGKDTVGHLLADKHNYLFISGSDILREECRKRGLPTTRENLSSISGEWRKQGGPGYFIGKIVETYEAVRSQYNGLVTASLRHPGEVDTLHALNGIVIWVDADPRIRYERIQSVNRGRADEDNKTFEEFLAEEEREMHPDGDPNALNMAGVRDMADIKLLNETNLNDFQIAIEQALKL